MNILIGWSIPSFVSLSRTPILSDNPPPAWAIINRWTAAC